MYQSENAPSPVEENTHSVPWTVGDTWLGLILLALLTIGMLLVAVFWRETRFFQSVGLVASELLYLAPVIYILAKRKVPWSALGFQSFNKNFLALGCGLLIMSYFLIMVHNSILALMGVATQGETIYNLFGSLDNPIWLIFVGIVLAPFVEEMFFRGFLFAGFRQRFGWKKSALFTSAIFAIAHLQPVALIPTFILGFLLAYLFHKSNSLWPGIILHFFVNTIGLCLIFAMSQMNI